MRFKVSSGDRAGQIILKKILINISNSFSESDRIVGKRMNLWMKECMDEWMNEKNGQNVYKFSIKITEDKKDLNNSQLVSGILFYVFCNWFYTS